MTWDSYGLLKDPPSTQNGKSPYKVEILADQR